MHDGWYRVASGVSLDTGWDNVAHAELTEAKDLGNGIILLLPNLPLIHLLFDRRDFGAEVEKVQRMLRDVLAIHEARTDAFRACLEAGAALSEIATAGHSALVDIDHEIELTQKIVGFIEGKFAYELNHNAFALANTPELASFEETRRKMGNRAVAAGNALRKSRLEFQEFYAKILKLSMPSEVTPSSFSSQSQEWLAQASNVELLGELSRVAIALSEIESYRAQVVQQAREKGATWTEIGTTAGISYTQAYRRWDPLAGQRGRGPSKTDEPPNTR